MLTSMLEAAVGDKVGSMASQQDSDLDLLQFEPADKLLVCLLLPNIMNSKFLSG